MHALKDKAFVRLLLAIAIPIALQNLVSTGVNLMDNIMLGAVGEAQISAASMANQVFFVYNVLCFGIAGGSNVLIAQYWGKGDRASIKKVLSLAYRAAVLICLVFMAAAFLCPEAIVNLFTKDPYVAAEALVYLKITRWTYPFSGMSSVMLLTLRPVGSVNIALVDSVFSLVTNTFLNWVLIFGNLGAPKMGIAGAAIATLVARVVEFVVAVVYMARFEKKIQVRPRDLIATDQGMRKDFMVNVLPVMCNEFIWSMGAAAIVAVIGNMSTGFLAANGIFSTISQLTLVTIWGISNATAVIIGNTIGEGKLSEVMPRARAMLAVTLLIGIAMGIVLWLTKGLILSFYNVTPETHQLAMGILSIGSVIVVFQSLSVTTLMGVLRGGGDARFVLIVDTVFMYLVSLPLGALAGFVLNWHPVVVYAIIKSDEALKALFGLWRIFKSDWIKDVTR